MKRIFIIAMLLVGFTVAVAQENIVTSEKKFTMKLKDIWLRDIDSPIDTVFLEENKFKIILDEEDADPAVSIDSVFLQIPGDKRDVTDNYKTEEFKIGNDSAFVFTFRLKKEIREEVETTIAMVKLKYQLPGASETKDTLISKESLLQVISTLSKTNLVLEQKDTLVTEKEEKVVDKIEKLVKIIFYKRGAPKTEMQKQLEVISKQLEDLFNENSLKVPIGAFTLKEKSVTIYTQGQKKQRTEFWKKNTYGSPKKEQANIKRVVVTVGNGAIIKKGVMVELADGSVFRNNQSPISIYRFNDRTGDKLYLQVRSPKKYIVLGDILSYNYIGKFHYPDDDSATLTPERKIDSLYNISTVNDLIDVAIYTDLLGLLGRKPNGLIQTQISGNFIINTYNFKNRDVIPFNFIRPYFRLSKLDSKFAQLDTTDATIFKNDTLKNRLYLNQISYLQAGVKLNIVRWGLGPNQQLLINAGLDVNLTSADSSLHKDVTTVNYYPEIEYRVNGPENFGLEVSLKWLRQEVGKNSPFNNKHAIWIFNPQALVYYSPFNNPGNRIYLKYSNYAEIKGGKYNFAQFQFGYKTNLFKKSK